MQVRVGETNYEGRENCKCAIPLLPGSPVHFLRPESYSDCCLAIDESRCTETSTGAALAKFS